MMLLHGGPDSFGTLSYIVYVQSGHLHLSGLSSNPIKFKAPSVSLNMKLPFTILHTLDGSIIDNELHVLTLVKVKCGIL